MEACATSHHWGRVARGHGHEVRLVPAIHVKPFVKRQQNDAADAEAWDELVPHRSDAMIHSVIQRRRAALFRFTSAALGRIMARRTSWLAPVVSTSSRGTFKTSLCTSRLFPTARES